MGYKQAKLKDSILKELIERSSDEYHDISKLAKFLDEDFDACFVACDALVSDGYIDSRESATARYPNDQMIWLLPAGKHFANSGSYSLNHEMQQRRYEDEDRKQALEDKKLVWDAQISRFQAKTKWLPLIIAGISLCIAIYAIIKPQSEIEELELELEKMRDTTLISSTPKE